MQRAGIVGVRGAPAVGKGEQGQEGADTWGRGRSQTGSGRRTVVGNKESQA